MSFVDVLPEHVDASAGGSRVRLTDGDFLVPLGRYRAVVRSTRCLSSADRDGGHYEPFPGQPLRTHTTPPPSDFTMVRFMAGVLFTIGFYAALITIARRIVGL